MVALQILNGEIHDAEIRTAAGKVDLGAVVDVKEATDEAEEERAALVSSAQELLDPGRCVEYALVYRASWAITLLRGKRSRAAVRSAP